MGIYRSGCWWIVFTPFTLTAVRDREDAVKAYLAYWEQLLEIERFNKEHQTEVA